MYIYIHTKRGRLTCDMVVNEARVGVRREEVLPTLPPPPRPPRSSLTLNPTTENGAGIESSWHIYVYIYMVFNIYTYQSIYAYV